MVDKIRALAKEKKVSIAEIEQNCGIGQKSIYNWDTSVPAVDKVKRVADFLGVTVEELISEVNA